MSFGAKILGLLAILTLVPIISSIYLIESAMDQQRFLARDREQRLSDAAEDAIKAYRQLFEARQAQFRAEAVAIAATWNGHIDDPAPRFIRHWKVEPDGPSGDSAGAFPDSAWRGFAVRQPLREGRTLALEFVAPREWFAEFEDIGHTLTTEQAMTVMEEKQHRHLHWIYVALFAIVMAPVLGLGILMARRTTGRLKNLTSAAREVGAGDLSVRLAIEGRDEIAQLGAAFNEMVGELGESRAKIAYLEKIGAWQEVARRLAHEIKNPLTPIQLAVQQLERKYGGDDPGFKKLLAEVGEIVGEEIGTLRRLVSDFSAFAKLPQVEAAPLELGDLVADTVRGRPDWEGRVRASALTESLVARADKQLLRRAIVNLVENALQAGARLVEIRAERGERGEPCAHVVVDDDGPGVPEEVRERIFEPYFTTKKVGTGLGLSIVRKIALEHGGDVVVGASPRGGARFVLELPLG